MVTRNQHLDQRMNWFDRQFLRAQDFADESDYQVDRLRRHLRTLHTSGVAEGLVVRGQPGDSSVTVDPGTAIDDQGREIVLISQSPAQTPPSAATTAELYVSYTEAQTSPSQDPGISGYTRISEIPQFTFRQTAPGASQPIPASGVLLGTLALSGGKLTSAPDISGQTKAGATIGDVSAFSVTLRRVGLAATAWPRLTATGPSQLGLAGDLRLSGQGSATGALGLPGPITLNDVALTAPGQNKLTVAGDLSLTSQGSATGALSLPGPLTLGGSQLTGSGPNQITLNGDLRLARQGNASGALITAGSIQSSGIQFGAGTQQITAISTDGSLGGNRNSAVPTEAAVKAYADGVRGYADSIKTFAQKNLAIQMGRVDFLKAAGSRSVSFSQRFAAPPAVLLSVVFYDVQPPRINLSADNVSASGFTVRFATWENTGVWQLSVQWLAFGSLA